MRGVSKNLRVGGAVGTALPVAELLFMAALAAFHHGLQVAVAKANCLRHGAGKVGGQTADVAEVEVGVHREGIAVAFGTGDFEVRGVLPGFEVLGNLMTPGAAFPTAKLIDVARRGNRKQCRERHSPEGSQHPVLPKPAQHPCNLSPRGLRAAKGSAPRRGPEPGIRHHGSGFPSIRAS